MSTPTTSGSGRRAAENNGAERNVTERNVTERNVTDRGPNRAAPTGAYVAIVGIVVFVVATFIDWVSTEDPDPTSGSGYETDTVIPLLAYLGLGLAVALLYALSRARGRQHRGLSLVTMAVGIAAVGISLSYVFDAPGAFERGSQLDTEAGAWIGLVGSVLWSIGAGLFAKEPEGDDDWRPTHTGTRDSA